MPCTDAGKTLQVVRLFLFNQIVKLTRNLSLSLEWRTLLWKTLLLPKLSCNLLKTTWYYTFIQLMLLTHQCQIKGPKLICSRVETKKCSRRWQLFAWGGDFLPPLADRVGVDNVTHHLQKVTHPKLVVIPYLPTDGRWDRALTRPSR